MPVRALEVVLFDLDGTLTDPSGDVVVAMTRALDSVDAPVPSEAVLRAHIGPPLLHTLDVFGLDRDTATTVLGRYRDAYRANRSADTTVHPGMPALLTRSNGGLDGGPSGPWRGPIDGGTAPEAGLVG